MKKTMATKPKKEKKTAGGSTEARSATKLERQAVRATGARKAARTEGKLTGIYTEEKGGKLATSASSGRFIDKSSTRGSSGRLAADKRFSGSNPEAKREEVARSANASFYGDTKLGQRIVKKAIKAKTKNPSLGSGISSTTGFAKATLKNPEKWKLKGKKL